MGDGQTPEAPRPRLGWGWVAGASAGLCLGLSAAGRGESVASSILIGAMFGSLFFSWLRRAKLRTCDGCRRALGLCLGPSVRPWPEPLVEVASPKTLICIMPRSGSAGWLLRRVP